MIEMFVLTMNLSLSIILPPYHGYTTELDRTLILCEFLSLTRLCFYLHTTSLPVCGIMLLYANHVYIEKGPVTVVNG